MSLVTNDMIIHCFDTIIHKLKRVPIPPPKFDTTQKYGIFVTWKIQKRGEFHLRGCIGCLVPIELSEIQHYAEESAFGDYRFKPIQLSEIPNLQCSVSLLHTFENAKDYKDWEVGKHGIRITFVYKGSPYRATYLPEVAPEQGWDQEETIHHLIEKAGCEYDPSILPTIQLVRYQTEKRSLCYSDYCTLLNEQNRCSLLELVVCWKTIAILNDVCYIPVNSILPSSLRFATPTQSSSSSINKLISELFFRLFNVLSLFSLDIIATIAFWMKGSFNNSRILST